MCIEVFPSEGWRSNGGSEEVETSSELDREGWTHDINVVWCGRVAGDGVGDGSGKRGIELEEIWEWGVVRGRG